MGSKLIVKAAIATLIGYGSTAVYLIVQTQRLAGIPLKYLLRLHLSDFLELWKWC